MAGGGGRSCKKLWPTGNNLLPCAKLLPELRSDFLNYNVVYKQLYQFFKSLANECRLVIYLQAELRYEKNCKSARSMSLAGRGL
ncbi:hypothetical protein ABIE62_002613 [Porphyrobacter sp. MBR-155]|jgi:hypothetical protein|uniref:hypothetical protein n=1 Tax=Porphyrobacter sp. MBR-155 TaxID=3156464 RepID=UPI003395347A